jgi:hypothetical protein
LNSIEIEESPQKQIVNWIDIDAEDYNDPAMVSEYVNDIYAYLFEVEVLQPSYSDIN